MNGHAVLHYRYAISYLIVGIIALTALAFFDVPDLVDKLNFALALSSLILAGLAIFQTILSQHKQEVQLSRLIETNVSLGVAADDIRSSAMEMRSFAQRMPNHFVELGAKIDKVTGQFSSPQLEGSSDVATPRFNSEELPQMFGQLQFMGMGVLLLFVRCHGQNKAIDLEVFKKMEIPFQYGVGFLNGFEATFGIDFRFHKGEIVPTQCDPELLVRLPKQFDRVMEFLSAEDKERLARYKRDVEEYVSKTDTTP